MPYINKTPPWSYPNYPYTRPNQSGVTIPITNPISPPIPDIKSGKVKAIDYYPNGTIKRIEYAV